MPVPRCEIVGSAVKDAKAGYDKNGKPYLFVRVAASDSHKDENDQWVTDRSIFVNVQWWGADDKMHVPVKGDRVRAFGRVYETVDTGQDGKEYRNTVMDAEFVRAWEKRQQSNGWGGQNQGQAAPQGPPPAGGFAGVDEEPPF